jgi:hypothetical protein
MYQDRLGSRESIEASIQRSLMTYFASRFFAHGQTQDRPSLSHLEQE